MQVLTPSKKREGGEKGKTPNRAIQEVIIGQCICCIIQKLSPAPSDVASTLVGTKRLINYSERKRLWLNLRWCPSI